MLSTRLNPIGLQRPNVVTGKKRDLLENYHRLRPPHLVKPHRESVLFLSRIRVKTISSV